MIIADLPIEFGEATEGEAAFVYDTWVESFRLAHAAGPIPMDMYRNIYREIIRRISQRPEALCLVARNADIPDQALGYVVCEPKSLVVHYVFVKHFFRKNGLATALLRLAGIDPKKAFTYTFKSRCAGDLVQHWSGGRFDPITIRKALAPAKET